MKQLVHTFVPTKHAVILGVAPDVDTLQQNFRVMIGSTEVSGEIRIKQKDINVIVHHKTLLQTAIVIDIINLSVFPHKDLSYQDSNEVDTGHTYNLKRS